MNVVIDKTTPDVMIDAFAEVAKVMRENGAPDEAAIVIELVMMEQVIAFVRRLQQLVVTTRMQ